MVLEAIWSAERRTVPGLLEFSLWCFLSDLDPWVPSRAFQGVLRRCQLGLSLRRRCSYLFGQAKRGDVEWVRNRKTSAHLN